LNSLKIAIGQNCLFQCLQKLCSLDCGSVII